MRKLKNSELGRISVDNFRLADKTPIIVILDNVRSAFNVGSIFRTSDAFRIEKLYLCGVTPFPPSKEIHKSALGSTDSVSWEKEEKTEDVICKLRRDGVGILAVEQTDNSCLLDNYEMNDKRIALVFGHEVFGVSQSVIDLCDESIMIPQAGTKHSLNVSVTVGIVLWDLFQKVT
tara:strand:- start:49 stop:573 length:525 start_codon:yes stop_codon:yes gene_type:complete